MECSQTQHPRTDRLALGALGTSKCGREEGMRSLHRADCVRTRQLVPDEPNTDSSLREGGLRWVGCVPNPQTLIQLQNPWSLPQPIVLNNTIWALSRKQRNRLGEGSGGAALLEFAHARITRTRQKPAGRVWSLPSNGAFMPWWCTAPGTL